MKKDMIERHKITDKKKKKYTITLQKDLHHHRHFL